MSCRSSGPADAKIMIVGDIPSEEDMKTGVPFSGQSGLELDRMLHEAGLTRSECFLTNVVRDRPYRGDIRAWIPETKKDIQPGYAPYLGKTVHPIVKQGVELTLKEISLVQPNVVVALGSVPLWGLCQLDGINSWRGSLLTIQDSNSRTVKVIPSLHPTSILRNWSSRNVAVHDLRRVRREKDFPERHHTAYSLLIRPAFWEAQLFLEDLGKRLDRTPEGLFISCDIETRGRRHIACVGLAISRFEAISIPLMAIGADQGYWSLDEEVALLAQLQYILTHPNARIIGQNFSYDAQYFAKEFGWRIDAAHDTLTAQQTLFPGTPKDLGYLSSLYCVDHVYWKNEGKEWDLNSGNENWEYNAKDACRTYEIALAQIPIIESAKLQKQFDFQMKLQKHTLTMMLRGLNYDIKKTPELSMKLHLLKEERLKTLAYLLGHPINPASPKQMHALFYTDFGIKPIISQKTKRPTLDDGAMQKIMEREPLLKPLINLILDYRSLSVFKSTFVDAKLGSDGRMHSSFNINGTYTFRMSSSTDAFDTGLNQQNIPTEESKSFAKAIQRGTAHEYPDIRKLYLPDEGRVFWNADLDRADLQVVVWEAQDRELMQMLREGVDLHVENAKVLFGLVAGQTVTKAMRGFAKAFVHGTNYGGSAATMATATGVTVKQAALAQTRWFQAHPGIKQWHMRVLSEITTTRMIKNKLGYRWVIFDRLETAFTEALAWVPQSTVACIINQGLVNIAENLPNSAIVRDEIVTYTNPETLLQVHDSLAGNMPVGFDPKLIQDQLLVELPYDPPLIIPASIEISPVSWGDCK